MSTIVELHGVKCADKNNRMFYHFGLKDKTVAICTQCGVTIDLAGLTVAEIATKMHAHWKAQVEN